MQTLFAILLRACFTCVIWNYSEKKSAFFVCANLSSAFFFPANSDPETAFSGIIYSYK